MNLSHSNKASTFSRTSGPEILINGHRFCSHSFTHTTGRWLRCWSLDPPPPTFCLHMSKTELTEAFSTTYFIVCHVYRGQSRSHRDHYAVPPVVVLVFGTSTHTASAVNSISQRAFCSLDGAHVRYVCVSLYTHTQHATRSYEFCRQYTAEIQVIR